MRRPTSWRRRRTLTAACTKLIHDMMTEHQRIVFNGNGYSDEWVEEAERRGLPNLRSMVDAVPALLTPKAEALFTKFGIYTKAELEARAEIMYETYAKVLKIEAKTMTHMAGKHYVPAAITYTTRLAESITAVTAACPQADLTVQRELLEKVSLRLHRRHQGPEQPDRAGGAGGRHGGCEGDGPGLPRPDRPRHGRAAQAGG